ncbi:MAG: hypothetical protein ACQKBV_01070 [Puniceicoccales bacterium]
MLKQLPVWKWRYSWVALFLVVASLWVLAHNGWLGSLTIDSPLEVVVWFAIGTWASLSLVRSAKKFHYKSKHANLYFSEPDAKHWKFRPEK